MPCAHASSSKSSGRLARWFALTLTVDRQQVIDGRDDAFQPCVGGFAFAVNLEGIDKSAPGMGETAGMDQILGADVFFVGDVSVGVKTSWRPSCFD
jgi:hypothetical protein